MKKKRVSAFAQRAFEVYALTPTLTQPTTFSFAIHPGSGDCVCAQCEHARKVLDQIGRAGK